MGALSRLQRDLSDQNQPLVETRQVLTFLLAGEIFAIAIPCIREILEYGTVTEVPLMPTFICGVMNLRGTVVPVIDLSLRLGRAATTIHRRTCIIIIEVEFEDQLQTIGVLVDAVQEVLVIPEDEIEAPPQFGSQIRTDFIDGIVRVEGRFVILLHVDQVLSVEEMALLATMDTLADAADEPLSHA
jgi:purine-binding chemotaxis protein CheW